MRTLQQNPGQKSMVGRSLTGGSSSMTNQSPKRGFLGEILPVGGSIVGAIGGGIVGAAAGVPEAGVGAIPGAYIGGVTGSAAGGAAGEFLQQSIEKIFGKRQSFSGKDIGKTALEQGALEAVGGPILDVGGKALEKVGGSLYKAAIPTSAKEALLLQNYKADVPFLQRVFNLSTRKAPTTAADTSFKFGLKGSESMLGVQAKRASTNLWSDLISPALEKSDKTINFKQFFKTAEEKIIKDNPEISRKNDLLEALKSIMEDYKKVKTTGLKQLQQYKEGWAKFVPEKAYKGKPITGAFNDVRDILASLARQVIHTSVPKEVGQAYFDYGNLKSLQELGQKAMTGGKLKGGFGSFWSAIKDFAVTPIATIGGRFVYRVGQGLEFVGNPGAKVLSDVLGITGKMGQDINPQVLGSVQGSTSTSNQSDYTAQ